jgi:hypothetical protein
MIEIPLTQGQVARVDDDCGAIAGFRWYTEKRERTYYAARNRPKVGGRNVGIVRMHHMVLPFLFGLEVDHIDGDGLNNCRSNLRLASRRNNQRNRRGNRGKGRTQLKGAYWHSVDKVWRAQIGLGGRTSYLGQFDTAEGAARAYDAAAREHYGEFARLNFPR